MPESNNGNSWAGKSVAYDVGQAVLLSGLVYDFTHILWDAREKKKDENGKSFKLSAPEGFTSQDVDHLIKESVDLTNPRFNGGNGLSMHQLMGFIAYNVKTIEKIEQKLKFALNAARSLIDHEKDGYTDDYNKNVFLMYHRSVQRDKACVYSIFKNKNLKRIYVVFRGTEGATNKDWPTNLKYFAHPHRTSPLIKDKMPDNLKEQVMVHEGFFKYLYDNPSMEGDQRGHQIYEDIQVALKDEEGYSIHVTGHSLGGALATLYSHALAGLPEEFNIPKPVTCISIAAPYSGTSEFKLATEHLERDGYLRSIRVNLPEDPIPKALPCTAWWPFHWMQHTGINLCLYNHSVLFEHSSRANFKTAIRNSILHPRLFSNIFDGRNFFVFHHFFSSHTDRLGVNYKDLKDVTIDDLYKDPKFVSKEFLEGTF